jgi:hypothetical protein
MRAAPMRRSIRLRQLRWPLLRRVPDQRFGRGSEREVQPERGGCGHADHDLRQLGVPPAGTLRSCSAEAQPSRRPGLRWHQQFEWRNRISLCLPGVSVFGPARNRARTTGAVPGNALRWQHLLCGVSSGRLAERGPWNLRRVRGRKVAYAIPVKGTVAGQGGHPVQLFASDGSTLGGTYVGPATLRVSTAATQDGGGKQFTLTSSAAIQVQ